MKELIDFKDKFNDITTSNEDIARLTLSLYDVYQTFFYEYQTFKGNLQNINPQLLSIINNLVSITCYKANNFEVLTVKDGFDKSQTITFTKENILLQNNLIITNEKLALEAIDFYHNNQLFLIAYQKLMNGFIFGKLFTTLFITISKSSFTELEKINFLFGIENHYDKNFFELVLSLEKKDLMKVKKVIVNSQKYVLCKDEALLLMKECYISNGYLPDLFTDFKLERK